MGFSNPVTLAQIEAAVPTAAENAAATDAAANSVAAATQSTVAATNSATARIRSMTRVAYTLSGPGTGVGPYTWDIPISVTDISRCQINLLGFYLTGGGISSGDFAFNQPSVYAVSNTILTIARATNSFTVHGFFEIMEWV